MSTKTIPKRGADGFYALRLTRLLHLEFKRWEAFKLGIIDDKGNLLRKAETPKEKSNWTMFHITVRNIKRLVHLNPVGAQILNHGASYLLLIELAKEYDLGDSFAQSVFDLQEEMVAGDAGGDPEMIAKGETSGAITGPGPKVLGKKKKKKKLKKFRHFD
ncbi:capsid protein [Vibrio phage 1.081.O._10N.286.52.C2]|nr:capsid protein [Vibrio phage 1.081.O._10N.286.52.C2]